MTLRPLLAAPGGWRWDGPRGGSYRRNGGWGTVIVGVRPVRLKILQRRDRRERSGGEGWRGAGSSADLGEGLPGFPVGTCSGGRRGGRGGWAVGCLGFWLFKTRSQACGGWCCTHVTSCALPCVLPRLSTAGQGIAQHHESAVCVLCRRSAPGLQKHRPPSLLEAGIPGAWAVSRRGRWWPACPCRARRAARLLSLPAAQVGTGVAQLPAVTTHRTLSDLSDERLGVSPGSLGG